MNRKAYEKSINVVRMAQNAIRMGIFPRSKTQFNAKTQRKDKRNKLLTG